MKITILTSRFPYPCEKGDKLRIFYQIKQLSQIFKISLISISDKVPSTEELLKLKEYCEEVHVLRISLIVRILNLIRGVLNGLPLSVANFYNPYIKWKIEKKILDWNPQVIYCQLIRMTEYVKNFPIPKVMDYMDAFSLGMDRRATSSGIITRGLIRREAKKIAKYEKYIYPYFEGHTIISERDRNHFAFDSASNILIVKNGVSSDRFTPTSTKNKKYDLAFIGNLGYYPNIKAAEYLIENIWPRIRPKGISLLINGARPSQRLLSKSNEKLNIVGWVPKIEDSYQSSRIFIAPIFDGSGLQNKILEAMSSGLPCITTSGVNDSINAIPGKEILIADTVEEFIEQIELLMADESFLSMLSQAGISFVKENYSWISQTEILSDLLKKIGNKSD